MGIEELKKAKDEEKKVFKRPSQKVAALLIALGPATASEILKNIKDEDLLEQNCISGKKLHYPRWCCLRKTAFITSLR